MAELWQIFSPYLLLVYYLGVFFVVVNILLENRNPLKAYSYLLLLLLLPFIGMVIYLFFGRNHRKRKIFSKRQLINTAFGQKYVDEHLDKSHRVDTDDLPVSGFSKLIHFLNKDLSPLTDNNRVQVLRNGEEKYPAILEAMSNAKSHIHLEYYIMTEEGIGEAIEKVLVQKAREGVEVRVIVDAVGSFTLSKAFFNRLKEAGVEIFEFMPVRFPTFASKINYRDHRKILIVDGTVGFTGGINLDNRYSNELNEQYWRDTHLKFEGEIVKTLQLLFFLNWQFVSEQSWMPSKDYFPQLPNLGKQCVQINASGPDWELASIMDSFMLAINSAQHFIRIATPYFIPNESILNSLTTTARSGVDVQLMIPYESDSRVVQWASLSFITELLTSGVQVFLYQKGFLHTKVMVVDGTFAAVGTANMDYRSFDLNYEVNAYLYDVELAETLNRQFEEDKTDCLKVSLAQWRERPLREKLAESVSRLLAPLL